MIIIIKIIQTLLKSKDPIIRLKARQLLNKPISKTDLVKYQTGIVNSSKVKQLISQRHKYGTISCHPYKKWIGAHWVLAVLSDLGYPQGDDSLMPLFEQEYNWLLSEDHIKKSLKVINGRVRRCASQESYAVYSALKLGLNDERTEELVRRLIAWQWEDGGWNCDKTPSAKKSSFMESIIPLRALVLHYQITGNKRSKQAAQNASEIFLKRYLYKRQSNGEVMNGNFTKLHYPLYWHYDILHGLKVMAEAGFISDKRCKPALDLLLSKQLSGGGFPAEAKYYQLRDSNITVYSKVDFGPTGKRKMNEYVTCDALYVLSKAGLVKFD